MEPMSIEQINQLQEENKKLKEALKELSILFRFGKKIIDETGYITETGETNGSKTDTNSDEM